MSSDTWIYPAPDWEPGDRVCIDSDGHPYYDELGHIVGPEDRDEDTWTVRLDSGEEIEAYSSELTGVFSTSPGGES